MNDNQTLTLLSRRNPVPEVPGYDDAAEAALRDLLDVFDSQIWEPGRVRRLHAPNRRTVRGAAAIGAAAAVAVGVFATTATNSNEPSGHPGIAVAPPSTGTTLDAKLVVDRTGQALAAADGYIVEGTQTTTGPTGTYKSVTWTDESDKQNFRVQTYDAAGQLAIDSTLYLASGQLMRQVVDYAAHEYTVGAVNLKEKTATPGPAGTQPGTSTTASPTSGTPSATANDATGIAQDLAQGTDSLVGETTLGGRSVLELSNDEPGMNRLVWIDPDTYLPVRMTANGTFGSYVIDYTWIPRTPQNLTEYLRPQVPAGFTQVNQLPGD